jgi:UDP-GlcNAc3NAcA epimerase
LKIVSVVGARPQFIKAAAVSRAIRAFPGIRELLLHTGQHYDSNMSQVFFEELEIPAPDINLGVGSGPHGAQTARMIEGIESALIVHRPDAVLIYGDTNSTLAAALAAAKLHIPVAHVEAGLRSFNRAMPEETNRVLSDHCSDLLFAPTTTAVKNLRNEGFATKKIHLVGDVMYDAARFYAQKAERTSRILAQLGLSGGGYVLCTIHRAENTDDLSRILAIFKALLGLANEIRVVLPLHPRTRGIIGRHAIGSIEHRNLTVIDPVGYLDMILLEKNARMIATDSGGVQKEAYFYHIPCATLRTETEWIELVDTGWNTLIDPRSEQLAAGELIRLINVDTRAWPHPDLFGDGAAAERVCALLGAHTAFDQDLLRRR